MKGLLYGNFVLNKTWFISAGIIAVLGMAFCAALCSVNPENIAAARYGMFAAEAVVIAVSVEWSGRALEKNLKNRFVDQALAGGVMKAEFVTSELLKNIISIGFSVVLGIVIQLILAVFDGSFLNARNIIILMELALITGAVEWSCTPLIIDLKSSEKAGMVVGLVLGFGMVCPIFSVLIYLNSGSGFMLDFGDPLFLACCAAVCAAVYGLFYLITLHRVKKGDVC